MNAFKNPLTRSSVSFILSATTGGLVRRTDGAWSLRAPADFIDQDASALPRLSAPSLAGLTTAPGITGQNVSLCPKSLFVESHSPRCDAFRPTRCRTWRVDFRALPEGIRPPLCCAIASRCQRQSACFQLHRFKNTSRILDCTDMSYSLTSASDLFARSVLASNKRPLIVLATSTCSLRAVL